ncbi:MAG TPA: DUF362 domain-containing protein [Pyrinomonadaceae bacterium]|nr:DUF362 domain-containing protein [Pyrinomonadaceae bacterium]
MLRQFIILAICGATLICGVSNPADPGVKSDGRVLMVEHPGATRSYVPQTDPVRELVRTGLEHFTGKRDITEAWLSLVSTQDIVGLKVYSAPGPASGTRKTVVAALIETLIEAGITPRQIVLWDRRLIDLRLAGYFELAAKYNVRVEGAVDSGFDARVPYSSTILGKLVFSDLEFGKRGDGVGKNSYVSTLLTREITKIVNVTPLLNHNVAGVSGVIYGLAIGSIDNTLRFEEPDRLANAVPEIYALPEIGDRVVLNIVDALICQYRGEERTLLHYSTPLNQLWFSTDPVALDVLALAELTRQNKERKLSKSTQSLYDNAALLELGTASVDQIRVEHLVLK